LVNSGKGIQNGRTKTDTEHHLTSASTEGRWKRLRLYYRGRNWKFLTSLWLYPVNSFFFLLVEEKKYSLSVVITLYIFYNVLPLWRQAIQN